MQLSVFLFYNNQDDISSVFSSLDFKLNCRHKFAKGAILIYGADKFCEGFNNKIIYDQKVKACINHINTLQTYLECGQKNEFLEVMNKLFDTANSIDENSHVLKNEIFYSLTSMFLIYINRINISDYLNKKIDLEKLTRYDSHTSWEELVRYFKDLSEKIFEFERQREIDDAMKMVQNVQEYINRNIGEDLSLTKLSSVFHFNASYFSRLYKSLTGENITAYINRVRLEKAKAMLGDESIKINRIAEELGFKTPSYFAYFFKKNANVSPQNYRDQLRQL